MTHGRKISVTGLGYVGLTVAAEFAKHGRVIGYDTNKQRIAELRKNFDRNADVSSDDLRNCDIFFTDQAKDLFEADFHIIAVPTPINKTKQPDLSMLQATTITLSEHLKSGDIVVYESTVYPGVTEDICMPLIEKHAKLSIGKDIFIGYSPERINPGDEKHTLTNSRKIIAAQDESTLMILEKVYSTIVIEPLHHVSSIKVAEAAKILENTQRDLNVALMNELAIIANRMNIDTHEIIDAAATKWNFLPFKPGLVGGHCIGVDPYYLTYKANECDYHPEVILAGRRINDDMGKYIAEQTLKQMIKCGKKIKGERVAILGLTFKENCPDLRNSRVMDILNELKNYDIDIIVHDPVANHDDIEKYTKLSMTPLCDINNVACVILCVAHNAYKQLTPEQIITLYGDGGPLIDVKGIFHRKDFQESVVSLWRL